MSHKRLHIRVPVRGEVSLSYGDAVVIKAKAIDISAVGMRISRAGFSPQPDFEYEVKVETDSHGVVRFRAAMVHEGEYGTGFRITAIDSPNLRIIYKMVTDFQGTEEFIHSIEQGNILEDWFVDEDGETLSIVFEEQDIKR